MPPPMESPQILYFIFVLDKLNNELKMVFLTKITFFADFF